MYELAWLVLLQLFLFRACWESSEKSRCGAGPWVGLGLCGAVVLLCWKHPASQVHHHVLFIKFTNERVSHLLEQCTTLPFAFSKKRLSLFIQTQESGHPSSHSSKIAHGRLLWEQGEFGRTWALWATVQGSFIRTTTRTVSFTRACSTRWPAYPDGHKGHFFLDIKELSF